MGVGAGMKLLMVLCPEERAEDVRRIIDDHEVQGYTEIRDLRGAGRSGRHLGTRAFPGQVCLTFTVVTEDRLRTLVSALREFCASCSEGEGVRTFVLDVQEMI